MFDRLLRLARSQWEVFVKAKVKFSPKSCRLIFLTGTFKMSKFVEFILYLHILKILNVLRNSNILYKRPTARYITTKYKL